MTDSDPLKAREARQAALNHLARRDYCTAELRSKLIDRGFDAHLVDDLLQSLQRERLIDDARYVEHFVSYHANRGQGPIRIERELRNLGVAADLITGHVKEGGQDWAARAREVRQKKFGREVPESYAGKAKQARFLQYRGFTGAQIRTALGTDIDLDSDAD